MKSIITHMKKKWLSLFFLGLSILFAIIIGALESFLYPKETFLVPIFSIIFFICIPITMIWTLISGIKTLKESKNKTLPIIKIIIGLIYFALVIYTIFFAPPFRAF